MNLTVENALGNNVIIKEIEITYKVYVSIVPGSSHSIDIPANQCEITVALDNRGVKPPEKHHVNPGRGKIILVSVKDGDPLTFI